MEAKMHCIKMIAALLLAFASSANGLLQLDGIFNNANVPSTGQEWISVRPGVEVQPADFSQESPHEAARMRATLQRMLDGEDQTNFDYDANFADSTDEYDDVQQAWRYLGLFVDCNPEVEVADEDAEEEERFLGSQDGDYNTTCARYVLWAAYIDPNYEGGGIGEYQYWDRHKGDWDTSACVESGTRCGKMDCHLPSTEFKLLGFFKQPNANDFMDQLFKHQGYCTWFADEYTFMQAHANVWPEGCKPLLINDHHGNPLYMDIKPLPGGDWSIGFYNDEICTLDHSLANGLLGRDSMSDMDILTAYGETYGYEGGSGGGSGNGERGDLLSLVEGINEWNNAMAMWKQCNPCRAYNIGNGQDSTAYDDDAANDDAAVDDDAGGNDDAVENDDAVDNDDAVERKRRRVEGDEDDAYTCNDDADYTNVNQCMKFFAKTDLQVATFRNLELANSQGSIMEIDLVDGRTLGSDETVNAYLSLNKRDPDFWHMFFFLASLVALVTGAAFFLMAWRKRNRKVSNSFSAPLVASEGELA